MLIAGVAGHTRHGCVALGDAGALRAVCAQERVTRVRGAGVNPRGLPDEALDLLLQRAGRTRFDVGRYLAAGTGTDDPSLEFLDPSVAHASAAYRSSPFAAATVVICDRDRPAVSVWRGQGANLSRVDWDWSGPGFFELYSRCADLIGLRGDQGPQRMEALARLHPAASSTRFDTSFSGDGHSIRVSETFENDVADALRQCNGVESLAVLAAELQGRIADLVLEFIAIVRKDVGGTDLCLGGSLFYHSAINTAVKRAMLFDRVFVPVDPGEAGLAVGAVLHAEECSPRLATPFLGPDYGAHEVKETLDNCKLHYAWESDENTIGVAVEALLKGTLVAWFDGPMEWGPRALGARCILANPFSPFVLENLNRFLKQREPWRGYALSGVATAVRQHFDGPADSPFMECDYRPKDTAVFRHALPKPGAALRIHTVSDHSPRRFKRLLEAFGSASGLPFLVNTSFNGFHEPIACSPRDAVRIFYATGVDLLVFEQFVLRK